MAKKDKQRARDATKQLERLRKLARKYRKGSEKVHHAQAAATWKELSKQSVKSSCCGKPPHKLCKSCPQRAIAHLLPADSARD